MLSHRGAVMIASLSSGEEEEGGRKKEDDQRRGAACNWRVFLFTSVREVAASLQRPSNWKKKCLTPKAAQTCRTAISVSMVTRHSPALSGELQIYFAHARPVKHVFDEEASGAWLFGLLSTPGLEHPIVHTL